MRKILLFVLFSFFSTAVFAQDALKEYRARNYQVSADICKSEIEGEKATVDTYCVLIWSLNKLKSYREALSYGNRALKLYKDMRIVEGMGVSYYYLGDYAKAMNNFKAYKAKQPDGPFVDDVCYFMGEIYIRNGEFNNADISLTEAVSRYPKSAKWWTRLGFAREQAGSIELAVIAYEEALKLNKNYADAKKGLARVKGE